MRFTTAAAAGEGMIAAAKIDAPTRTRAARRLWKRRLRITRIGRFVWSFLAQNKRQDAARSLSLTKLLQGLLALSIGRAVTSPPFSPARGVWATSAKCLGFHEDSGNVGDIVEGHENEQHDHQREADAK